MSPERESQSANEPDAALVLRGWMWSPHGDGLDLYLRRTSEVRPRALRCRNVERFECSYRCRRADPPRSSVRWHIENMGDRTHVLLDFGTAGTIELQCEAAEWDSELESDWRATELGHELLIRLPEERMARWAGQVLETVAQVLPEPMPIVTSLCQLASRTVPRWTEARDVIDSIDHGPTGDLSRRQRRVVELARLVALVICDGPRPSTGTAALPKIPRIAHGILMEFSARQAVRAQLAELFRSAMRG